jgi:ATP-dependent Clp protease ATP-binding subunit ClpA
VAEVQADLHRLPADQQKLRGSLIMQGYNFTERVRKVLALAREEAAELSYEYVGTEHLLLAIIREGSSTAYAVMTNFGVNSRDLRASIIEGLSPREKGEVGRVDLPYSSRAKKTLELAMSEARDLNHNYVGTEHLLLGLIREEKGVAAQALKQVGMSIESARVETLRVLFGAGGHQSVRHTQHLERETLVGYPQRLREVMADAYDIAAERGASEVTPAHAMIALLEHGEGMANAALDRLNFDRATALFALNDLATSSASAARPDRVIVSSVAMRSALDAMDAAQRAGASTVPGTHHLLLGIIASAPDIRAVFESQGLKQDAIREEIRRGSG